jgi:hypothetical protein
MSTNAENADRLPEEAEADQGEDALDEEEEPGGGSRQRQRDARQQRDWAAGAADPRTADDRG